MKKYHTKICQADLLAADVDRFAAAQLLNETQPSQPKLTNNLKATFFFHSKLTQHLQKIFSPPRTCSAPGQILVSA